MPINFLKSLDADDIFISYSRADGSAYLKGLDAALSARGFSCFTDERGTDADPLPPKTLFAKIRACKTLVLLGTPGALGHPENITPELTEFAASNGTARIVCVGFDRGAKFDAWPDVWHRYVVGKAREREDPGAIRTGKPSDSVVETVARASDYMKSKDRLRKYRNRTAGVLALLLVLTACAAGFARHQLKRAARATQDAEEALLRAFISQTEARVTGLAAELSRGDAEEQKRLAELASDDAAEKTRLADAAARRARAEEARADREQAIGDARSLADRSRTLVRRRPEELPRAVSLAVESLNKSTSVGLHAVEADTALRDSVALLPRLRRNHYYSLPGLRSERSVALSPDGRHFAAVTAGGRLQVYESGKTTPYVSLACACREVALSLGAARAAAITDNGVEVFDLGGGDKTGRPVPLPGGFSPEHITLSPGGRYVALTADSGPDRERRSSLLVLEVASGKVFTPFGRGADTNGAAQAKEMTYGACGNFDMLIYDVAFGPGGDLAVGGRYTGRQGASLRGRVVFWPLRPGAPGEAAERELNEASFSEPEVVPQEEEVRAVAPGADGMSFATDGGVWKRTPGGPLFEPVALLPGLSGRVKRLAFGPDGLTLLRWQTLVTHKGPRNVQWLEQWDGAGHRESAQVFQETPIGNIGFRPNAEFVATTTAIRWQKGHVRAFRTGGGAEVKGPAFGPRPEDGEVVYVAPGSGRLVTAGRDAAQVWDVWREKRPEKNPTAQFGRLLRTVEAATLNHDGRFLALSGPPATGGDWIVVYRRQNGSYEYWKTLPHLRRITSMLFSEDGRRLAVLSQTGTDYVRVYDVGGERDVTPDSLKRLDGVEAVALSPCGRFIVAARRFDNLTLLLDLSEGRAAKLRTLLEDAAVKSLAFSQDGRYLGLGSGEGILHVFEMTGPPSEIARVRHAGRVTAVAFSDGGRYVATAGIDSHPNRSHTGETYPLRVWLLRPAGLIDEASDRLRSLPRYDR